MEDKVWLTSTISNQARSKSLYCNQPQLFRSNISAIIEGHINYSGKIFPSNHSAMMGKNYVVSYLYYTAQSSSAQADSKELEREGLSIYHPFFDLSPSLVYELVS